VGRRADVLLDPFGGTPRGFVCAGLVLADRDSDATLAAPKCCVADEAGHPSDEVLDLLVPLLELIEEFRRTLPRIAANDCVHHCLLETRHGSNTLSDKPRSSRYARCQSLRLPSCDLLRVYERALGQP